MYSIVEEKENAYLTVYLSLIFGIVLSLLLVLIQGAATGTARAQAEIVADLGLDSVFAEYNRELFHQYGLFFIDSSYGSNYGGIGMVEQHLSTYMEYNLNPGTDLILHGDKCLVELRNPYLEISEAAYASDNCGTVWKAQAVNYIKAVYGGDLVSMVKEQMDTVTGSGFLEYNIQKELERQKKEFEDALAANNIMEYDKECEQGYSYQKITGMLDSLIGRGILMLVLPDRKSVSGAVTDKASVFSSRRATGKINKGTGLHPGSKFENTLIEELLYGEYLMKMYGSFMKPKENGQLQYQIEYILYGNESDTANLGAFAERLFVLRAAANAVSMAGDTAKKEEAATVAQTICTLLLVPQLTDALKAMIVSVWVFAETVSDVHALLEGGKIPLIKHSNAWNTNLSSLLNGKWYDTIQNTDGLGYQDYLRIFLGLMDREEKMARSLDIVEMDIRQTAGNDAFRIDLCIDSLKAEYGFEDMGGHSFVFSRSKCYCD